MAAYFGVNYLFIAALQTNATTQHYGFAVQTGALIASGLLGLLWLWVAWKDKLRVSFKNNSTWRWFLFPLALLVFWSPIGIEGSRVVFNFNLLLLLTQESRAARGYRYHRGRIQGMGPWQVVVSPGDPDERVLPSGYVP